MTMDLVKTIAAIGGVALGAISGVWSVGVTFGRTETEVVRATLGEHVKTSDTIHTVQDERLKRMEEDVRSAKESSLKAANNTDALLRERTVRPARGGRSQ